MRRTKSSSSGKDKKKKFKRFKERRCRFTKMGIEHIDWKDVATLQRLCTGQGKVLGRKRSGSSARFQRLIKVAIKRARYMGLMPYVGS